MSLNESIVEDAALEWLGGLGDAVGHGPHPAPGEPAAEREREPERSGTEAKWRSSQTNSRRQSFGEVVPAGRLREAIRRLNPVIPEEVREEALRKVLRVGTPSLTQSTRAIHRMLRDGVGVEYPRGDGSIKGDKLLLVDITGVQSKIGWR